MKDARLSKFVLWSFAALIVFPYRPAAAQVNTKPVNGRVVIPVDDDIAAFGGDDGAPVKGGIALRSSGGELAQRLQRAVKSGLVPIVLPIAGEEGHGNNRSSDDAFNVQVNDPTLDHIVTFDPTVVKTRPFEFSTQSETSAVRDGRHVVVGYNSSAGSEVQFFPGFGLAFTRLQFSGFSTSHDAGRTWTSGFVPPVSNDAPFTFGDPSLAIDRHGNIFYASLGTDAQGLHNTIIINKSTDHGSSFGPATVAAVDDGADKEWLAIGPDPTARSRDNIYVTWTSFITNAKGQTIGSQLRLARSTDGGQTFSQKVLFAPVDDGTNSSFIQFSNPVVDASTGRLYVPFLHFSDMDADNVRVLVSDDGGQTLRFLAFNAPGAIDSFAFPNVTPGLLNDCAGGGIRNALVAGADQGGGRFGLPRFKQATRLISQPHAAAGHGVFAFVLNSSTSPFLGDPTAGSEIRLVLSTNGGQTFATPFGVAASTAADPQHVHPFLSLSTNGRTLTVSYYVQQADKRLRTDVATLKTEHGELQVEQTAPLSTTAFDLTPSNVVRTPTATSNYDRTVVSCYDIGEYQTLTGPGGEANDDGVIAAWGDNRRTWTSPAGSPAAGTHSQPDVFSVKVDH
ncbi:MAG TPA: sialidase family protein [Candidatus Acidoferrum sp.]|nr:sialidase family protein [Candidatus Acidoferrum sp.]